MLLTIILKELKKHHLRAKYLAEKINSMKNFSVNLEITKTNIIFIKMY